MDAGAALGGLAASTMLPGLVVKDTSTTTGKVLKITAALASTVLAGFVFKNVNLVAGRMAIAGGLAGTLTQVIGMFTDIQIGRPVSRVRGRIGESRFEPAGGACGMPMGDSP